MASCLWRPDSHTKEAVEKCLILRTSKIDSSLQKRRGIWKRKLARSCVMFLLAWDSVICHMDVIPCAALLSSSNLNAVRCSGGVHLRERRYVPHYLTDLLHQFSTCLCNSLNSKQSLWEWLLVLGQLDGKEDRRNLRGWKGHGGSPEHVKTAQWLDRWRKIL